jgi:hypothetical protein|nr:MAG TPA: hypothetical protein [Caudoviricetes sp.]
MKEVKYYAITETIPIQIHLEPKTHSEEDMYRIMDEMKRGLYFDKVNPEPPLPQYMTIPMSEETYKFICNVSNIYSTSFGEKEYEINKVKFKIFTEEEYELRYGKCETN